MFDFINIDSNQIDQKFTTFTFTNFRACKIIKKYKNGVSIYDIVVPNYEYETTNLIREFNFQAVTTSLKFSTSIISS